MKKREHEKESLVVFFMDHNIVHYLNPLHACVPGCVVCRGREAANECSVTLLLSHSERPEYMEAVETANTAHQIWSVAALVSPVWEAARESNTWPTRLFIHKLE